MNLITTNSDKSEAMPTPEQAMSWPSLILAVIFCGFGVGFVIWVIASTWPLALALWMH